MLGTILTYIIVGAIIGVIARFALPGRDPMSIPMTILLGIAGAVIGGLIGDAIFGDDGGVRWILSVLVAIGLLLAYRQFNGRSNRAL